MGELEHISLKVKTHRYWALNARYLTLHLKVTLVKGKHFPIKKKKKKKRSKIKICRQMYAGCVFD